MLDFSVVRMGKSRYNKNKIFCFRDEENIVKG